MWTHKKPYASRMVMSNRKPTEGTVTRNTENILPTETNLYPFENDKN